MSGLGSLSHSEILDTGQVLTKDTDTQIYQNINFHTFKNQIYSQIRKYNTHRIHEMKYQYTYKIQFSPWKYP